MSKTLEEYKSVPYGLTVVWDSDDSMFVARVNELPGCAGHGATREAAIQMATESIPDWIETLLELGEPIPEPAAVESLPSGKWLQRVPRAIHASLVRLAEDDGTSLNQFVTAVLSMEVGRRLGRLEGTALQIHGAAHTRESRWGGHKVGIVRWQFANEPTQKNNNTDQIFVSHLLEKVAARRLVGSESHAEGHKVWEH